MDTLCFFKHARPVLIAWGYIKLVLILLATVPLYIGLIMIIFYGTKYEIIIFWLILISYPTALGFDIVLILAAHLRKVTMLKVCFYYLIFELLLTLLLVPWIVKVIHIEYNLLSICLSEVIVIVLLIVQGVGSILMVNSEINKLSDVNGVIHEEVGYSNLKDRKETI